MDENSEVDMAYKEALLEYENTLVHRITRPWLYNNFLYYNFTKSGATAKKALKTLNIYANNLIKQRRSEFQANNNVIKNDSSKKGMSVLDILIIAEHEGKIDIKGIQDEIATLMFGVSFRVFCVLFSNQIFYRVTTRLLYLLASH